MATLNNLGTGAGVAADNRQYESGCEMDTIANMLFGRSVFTLLVLFTPTSGVNNGVTRENIDSFLYPGRTNARNCLHLASELKEMGIWADVVNLHRAEEPRLGWGYDRVVIGVPIRYTYYHSAFQEFVKKYATRLQRNAERLYSVNPWRVAEKRRRRPTATRVSLMSSVAT